MNANKIPLHINKESTGIYLIPPPISARKHHDYINLKKKKNIDSKKKLYVTIHHTNGVTPTKILAKCISCFRHLCHHPQLLLFSQIKK